MSNAIVYSAPASDGGRFSPRVREFINSIPARWPGTGVESVDHQGEESVSLFSERHGLAFLSLDAHRDRGVRVHGPEGDDLGEHQGAEGLDAAVTGFMNTYGAALCRYGFKEA